LAEAPSELRIARRDLDSILRRGKEQLPFECCGLMIGTRRGNAVVCDHLVHTENADKSPVSFTIAPEELLKGYQHADEVSMELVGIYHSHPAPALPSETDLGYMKWSAPVWLIVSTIDWGYAAFRLAAGKPVGVRISLL